MTVRSRPLINSFNTGEVTPKLDARVDFSKYQSSCRILENMIPLPQGGAVRRPGTYFAYETKDSDKKSRVIGFQFSTVQAYILEFGDTYIRVFKDKGIVLSGDDPYEIVSPYDEDDLFDLKFVPSNDVVYIFHPSYAPYKLTRTGHTAWTLTAVTWTFDDAENITGATQADPCVLTVTGHSFSAGDEVIVQSVAGMTEINNRLFYVSAPATNTLALKNVNSGGYTPYTSGGTITRNPYSGKKKTITAITEANPAVVTCAAHGYANGTVVLIRDVGGMVEVNDRIFTVAGATTDTFQLSGINSSGYTTYTSGGIIQAKPFTATNEYPSCGAFFEGRLILALDQTVWGSRPGDYENFQAGSDDDHSFSYTIASDRADGIQWIMSKTYCMLGTIGGVWRISGSSDGPITPTSIDAKKQSDSRALNVEPEMVDDTILFVQRGGRRVKELAYSFAEDSHITNDMTVLAEHIGKGTTSATSGICDMDYQAEPFPILRSVRNDGQLLGFVRDRMQQVAGWFRTTTGKTSSTSWDKVESVAVISSEGEEDEVWVIVAREIDGSTKRYVEYFMPHEFFSQLKDYFGVDSGLSYDGGDAVAITGISNASPAMVSCNSHSFEDGDTVRIYGVTGMTEVNLGKSTAYTVANAGATTFELSGIDSTGWGVYVSGGYIQKVTGTITGLDHLEGRTIDIMIDGAKHPQAEVVSGEVELSWYGNLIHAGLPFTPILQPMKIETQTGDGSTSQGKEKRIYNMTARFYETCGAKWGYDADHLDIVPFGTGRAPELFTGDMTYPFNGDISTNGDIYITQDGPMPMTVLSIIAEVATAR
jgi:hypothetical protein